MATMTSSEARAALPEVLTRVASGEEVTITRHGRAVAVVVRPDTLRSRRADGVLEEARQVDDMLARGRGSRLTESDGLSERVADDLVAAIRAERERR